MKYKASTSSKTASPKKSGGGTLVGLFIGLIIGVLIAAGVVWFLHRTPLPFQGKESRPAETKAPVAANGTAAPAGAAATPQQLPAKPGEKPRFEFYKILPGGTEGAPAPAGDPKQASTLPPAPSAPAAPAAPAAAPVVDAAPAKAAAPAETFFLQVGAFQKAADADNMKARLAMLNVDANVQQIKTADKGTLFRVRVGGYSKPEDMNRVRNQLSQNGIQATVIKVKEAN